MIILVKIHIIKILVKNKEFNEWEKIGVNQVVVMKNYKHIEINEIYSSIIIDIMK